MEFSIEKNKHMKVSKNEMMCDYILDENLDNSIKSMGYNGLFTCVIGPPKSGKTNVLIELLKKKQTKNKIKTNLYGLYDNIHVISPSLHTMKENIFKDLEDDELIGELKQEFLENYINFLNDEIKRYKTDIEELEENISKSKGNKKAVLINKLNELKKIPYTSLIIFDDIGEKIRKNKKIGELLELLVNRRRHLNCNIILLLQNYYQIPPDIRSKISHLFIFRPKTKKELIKLCDIVNIENKYLNDFVNYVFDVKHNFLYIDMSQNVYDGNVLYKNFDRLHFDKPVPRT